MNGFLKENKLSFSQFSMKVIGGSAIGIIVAVIPNAIFGQIFINLIPFWSGFESLNQVIQVIQLLMPVLVGIGVGMQLNFNGMQALSVGAASFIGSGSVMRIEDIWQIMGVGDTANAMLTAGIAAYIVLVIQKKVASFATIAYPTLVGAVGGAIGLITLPYISHITTLIGDIVGKATELQPVLMGIIISIIFALLILTPISVVAIAMAISLNGIGSGAGNLGTVATVVFMAIGSYRAKNELGITLSIILGGVKTMMPNFFKQLKISIPLIFTAGILGALGVLLNIQGTPGSAGFGFAGLVGPIVAYGYLENNPIVNIIVLVLIYAVIPIIVSLLAHYLCTKVFKILDYSDYKIEL